MKISSIAGGLRDMTYILNLPTDLHEWKAVNRKRRSTAMAMRAEIVEKFQGEHAFPTDLMSIQCKKVGFWFDKDSWALEDVNFSVPQGSLVAILGKHNQGRQTLLKLIAHKHFPKEGEVFIPTHLRILHVSQEPYILPSSILDNLSFGVVDVDVQEKIIYWKCFLQISC